MHVASIESCSEYSQAKVNVEVLVRAAKELQVSGKLTSEELIDIDQDAGLYSKRMKDLCNFFINERITFQEYQDGVNSANSDYEKLRTQVLNNK